MWVPKAPRGALESQHWEPDRAVGFHFLFKSSPQPETVEGPEIEGGGGGEEHASFPFLVPSTEGWSILGTGRIQALKWI